MSDEETKAAEANAAAASATAAMGTPSASGTPPADEHNEEHRTDEQVAEAKAKQEAEDKVKTDKEAADKKAEEDKDKTKDFDAEAYVTVDNAEIMEVMEVLKEREIPRAKAQEIFGDAFKSGNPDDIDIHELRRTVGKQTANMMLKTIKQAAVDQGVKQNKALEAVHTAAGGKEQWDKAEEWAKTNYSGKDAADLNAMFKAGGRQAILATKDVMNDYKNSDDYVEPASLEKGDGKGSDLDVGGALDRAEYLKLTEAEYSRKEGPRRSELAKIEARREKSRK